MKRGPVKSWPSFLDWYIRLCAWWRSGLPARFAPERPDDA